MTSLLNSLAVSFDLPILDWIQAHLQSGLMDTIMPIITLFGDAGIFWMILAALLLFFPKTRRTGIGMFLAMIMGLIVCNITLKPLVARIRPYDYQLEHFGKTIELLVAAPHDYSFPSGHTLASFEAATVIFLNHKKLGIPALILASLIAFSRLYLYVHWPTDVLGGALLGAFLGWAAGEIAKKCTAKRKNT